VGDRAGEGKAYGSLGIAYNSLGDYAKAIAYLTEGLAIAKEVGEREEEGGAYGNLGTCYLYLNEYVKAVAYFEAQHALAISLKLAHVQSHALNMVSPSPFTSGQLARALPLLLARTSSWTA
jgi:tetratricopeptide (TPR) repeat protein